jgi:hypothetical protein
VQQANAAFERQWRSRHDESYHDALPAAVGNQIDGGPFRQLVRPSRNRDRAREFLQAMLEAELEEALGRSRLIKQATRRKGIRNSSPPRCLHLAKILGCYACNRVKILRSNRGSVKMSAVGTSANVARCGCQAANRLSGLFDIRIQPQIPQAATRIRLYQICNRLKLRYARNKDPSSDPNCTVALRFHICAEALHEP